MKKAVICLICVVSLGLAAPGAMAADDPSVDAPVSVQLAQDSEGPALPDPLPDEQMPPEAPIPDAPPPQVEDQPIPQHIQAEPHFIALDEVVGAIAASYPGRMLSASGPSASGGGYVYRIKWLTDDGAVLYIDADAESGSILSVEGA